MHESTAQLQRLINSAFLGVPIPDEDGSGSYVALLYMRWWSSECVDVVTVYDEHEATAYRAIGVDPRWPDDVRAARLRWRTAGSVCDVVAAMLELPAPEGRPVVPRPADGRTAASGTSRMWLP